MLTRAYYLISSRYTFFLSQNFFRWWSIYFLWRFGLWPPLPFSDGVPADLAHKEPYYMSSWDRDHVRGSVSHIIWLSPNTRIFWQPGIRLPPLKPHVRGRTGSKACVKMMDCRYFASGQQSDLPGNWSEHTPHAAADLLLLLARIWTLLWSVHWPCRLPGPSQKVAARVSIFLAWTPHLEGCRDGLIPSSEFRPFTSGLFCEKVMLFHDDPCLLAFQSLEYRA